jgi:hypothetical protein
MVEYPRTNWPRIVLSFQGTVLNNIRGRVFAITIYSLVVQLLYEIGLERGWIVAESLGKIDAAA